MKRGLLGTIVVLWAVTSVLPAWASESASTLPPSGALEWGDSLADAFRSSFLGAETVTATVDAADPGLSQGRASKVYLGVKGYGMGGMIYNQLMIELRDVAFSANGKSLLIKSIGSGSLTGRLSAENYTAALERNYPRFNVTKITMDAGRLDLWGVYSRKAMIPLRATMHFWGTYRVNEGKAALSITDGTNDNSLVSLAAVAKAMEKAAPQLAFDHLVVPMSVQSVTLDAGTMQVRASSSLQ